MNSASAQMSENPSHACITPYFLRNICSLSNNFPEQYIKMSAALFIKRYRVEHLRLGVLN